LGFDSFSDGAGAAQSISGANPLSRNTVIAGQAGISFGGFLFGQASRFAFNLLVARALGADALGIYALAIAVMQIAEVLATAGLDSALLRFVNLHQSEPLRQKEVIGSAIKTSLFFSFSVAMLLLLFSGTIASQLHGSRLLQLVICCYAAAIPFNVLTMLFGHAMQGFRNLRPKIIATQVVSPLLLLLLTIFFRYTLGYNEALIFPFALAAVGSFLWIRPNLLKITGVVSRDIFRAPPDRTMLAYALPFMGVSLLSMMTHWIDVMMLGMFTDTATVGIYHPAARTAGLIRAVLLAFSGIAAPMIAELHAGSQSEEIGRIYRMVTRWIIAVVIPPVLLFILLPGPVLGLFGSRFGTGSTVLVLLTFASFLQVSFGLSSTVLAMTGHARLSLLNALGVFLLQVGLNYLLIPRMGINGAALGTLIVFALFSAIRVFQIHHFLKITPFGKVLWKPVVSGILTALLLLFIRSWLLALPSFTALAVGLLLSVGAYASMMLLLKLEEDEREIILKFIPFLGKKPKQ
jgi:O-antigen/teichoic acid export membrane protein